MQWDLMYKNPLTKNCRSFWSIYIFIKIKPIISHNIECIVSGVIIEMENAK